MHQGFGLAFNILMATVFFGMGLWLAFFPGAYLNAAVKYSTVRFLSPEEARSPWWRLAFRLLGCVCLAVVALDVYALLYSR